MFNRPAMLATLALTGVFTLSAPAAAQTALSTDGVSEVGQAGGPAALPTLAPARRVPGKALIKLANLDPTTEPVDTALAEIRRDLGIRIELLRPSILRWGIYEIADAGPGAKVLDEAATLRVIKRIARHPMVEGASDERRYRALKTPTDPGWQYMWGLDNMGAPAAWELTTGLSSQRVGVVDTGTLRNHEDLAAKAVAGYDFISDSGTANDGNGRDADYEDAGDGGDCGFGELPDSWHGSHVAGTILASTENGVGIPGMNWQAGLVTARALGRCGGNLSDIMEGAAWMVGAQIDGVPTLPAEDRVSVMNLSLGGAGGCSGYEQDVIDFINGQGVIFVAAAGNDGGSVNSPGNCTGVVTVAAHGPSGGLTNYSSFGTSVEVVAPGGEMLSSAEEGILSAVGPGNDAYDFHEGTSMAAPHVTGAISLMQALDPNLTREQINALLNDNGDDCSGCEGKKRLNLSATLGAVSGGAVVTPDPDPTPDPTAGDDAYEENDSWNAAPTLDCGASYELFAGLGDQDWFLFDVPAGSTFEAFLDGGDQDLDLFVTDGPTNDNVVAESTSPTGQESVALTGASGTLAVVMAPWENASGAYALVVTCGGGITEPEPEPDPTDPGTEEPVPTDPELTDPGSDEPVEDPIVPGDDDAGDDGAGEGMNQGLNVRGGCAQTGASSHLGFAALSLLLFVRRRR